MSLRLQASKQGSNLHYAGGATLTARSLESRECSLARVREMWWKREAEQERQQGKPETPSVRGSDTVALCMNSTEASRSEGRPAADSQCGN